MWAVVYDRFGGPLRVDRVDDPVPQADGAVIAVRATGVCRSDWHGWQGHDPDISNLPHIPGHEFVGEIVEVGSDVRDWVPGDRVTIPFVAGCGHCTECLDGAPQVCRFQFQPGFSGWGSFAEKVAVRYADFNLVRVPPEIGDLAAVTLGCRLGTAYRAVAIQARTQAGEWVAVHGCGGVGLSALMVARAIGARPIAIDVDPASLRLASGAGAVEVIDARGVDDVAGTIREITGGGAHVSIDALGNAGVVSNSLWCLRPRGRHIQVGLLVGEDAQPRLPMEVVISRELEIRGSHGIAATDYSTLLELVRSGRLDPAAMVRRTLSLSQAPEALTEMGEFGHPGVSVVLVGSG